VKERSFSVWGRSIKQRVGGCCAASGRAKEKGALEKVISPRLRRRAGPLTPNSPRPMLTSMISIKWRGAERGLRRERREQKRLWRFRLRAMARKKRGKESTTTTTTTPHLWAGYYLCIRRGNRLPGWEEKPAAGDGDEIGGARRPNARNTARARRAKEGKLRDDSAPARGNDDNGDDEAGQAGLVGSQL